MLKKLLNFAHSQGFLLTEQSANFLVQYADLVWQKKDQLNLTSVSDKNEILTRHICDGLVAAALMARYSEGRGNFTLADMGSGAGYIGMTVALSLPHIQVTLVESLQRRCTFLNWALLKLGVRNVKVENIRLGQQAIGPFDAVLERAMGKLEDILPLLALAVKEGGVVAAYQSTPEQEDTNLPLQLHLLNQTPFTYQLPQEEKKRYVRIFVKYGHH